MSMRCTVKSDPADGVVRVAVAAWTKSPRFTSRRATTPSKGHDLSIGEQRLDPLHGRGGDVDLGGRDDTVRFRNAEIRLGHVRGGAHLIERPVADEVSRRAQLLAAPQQGVLKRNVRLVVVQLAARALQRTLLGFELGLGLGKLLL